MNHEQLNKRSLTDIARAIVGVASFGVFCAGIPTLVGETMASQGEVSLTSTLLIGGVALAGVAQSIPPIERLSGRQR